MTLYISKVEGATTNVSYTYFDSEHVWGILVNANYTFHINDVTGIDDDKMQVGMEAIEDAYARPNISAKIGVDEFRNGNVTSIAFDESKGVDKMRGSISIEERLRVVDDAVLSNVTDMVPSPQDVQSFSENFQFNRGANTYNYNRSVELVYKQDAGSEFLNKAYLFLKNVYLSNRPSYGYQVDDISEYGRLDAGLKPTVTEELNLINKRVAFTETLNTSRIETTGGFPFSKQENHSLTLQENGYTTKTFSVGLQALTEPFETNIASGVVSTIDNLISQNSVEFGSPISISKGLNGQGGIAEISVIFSNDPRLNNTTNIDYNASKSETSEGYSNYQFNLNVTSKGKNDITKFNLNKDYWKANTNLPYIKIPALFPEINSGDLNEVSRNISFQPFGNSVTDSSQFTNDPRYETLGDGTFKRTATISDRKQVQRDIVLPIYGNEEIIIEGAGKTLGERSISVTMNADNPNVLVSGSLSYASGFAPETSHSFLTRQTTNLNAVANQISTNLAYTYFDEL